MNDGTNPIHHVLEEVHEVGHRVGLGLQLDILEEPIQRCLSVEFGEGDGLLWACAGAGAGWWSCTVGCFDVVGCSGDQCWQFGVLGTNWRVKVWQN